MQGLKRLIICLLRFRHSHGFGVQSPFAYHLIRDVIRESYPYYAYTDLRTLYPHADTTERKLSELYFRLANAFRPQIWFSYHPVSSLYESYIHAGCVKTQFVVWNEKTIYPSFFQLAQITLVDDGVSICQHLLDVADMHSVLILEQIYNNRKTRLLWESVRTNPRIGMTFDLYDCGIVFFDRQYFKQNFKVYL